jgi:hypothetical protein
VIKYEDRLRRAKYLAGLADRLFRDECARLGLNVDEAMKFPLSSIITRQLGTCSGSADEADSVRVLVAPGL